MKWQNNLRKVRDIGSRQRGQYDLVKKLMILAVVLERVEAVWRVTILEVDVYGENAESAGGSVFVLVEVLMEAE